MSEENFKIEIIGRLIIIRLRGDIDIITATQFDDFMRCNIGKYETFVIDMSLIDYLNSTGLGTILAYCKLCRIFIIPPVRKILINVLHILEIGKYISICQNIDEVFQNLKEEVNKDAVS